MWSVALALEPLGKPTAIRAYARRRRNLAFPFPMADFAAFSRLTGSGRSCWYVKHMTRHSG
jgi:hypothetical protein